MLFTVVFCSLLGLIDGYLMGMLYQYTWKIAERHFGVFSTMALLVYIICVWPEAIMSTTITEFIMKLVKCEPYGEKVEIVFFIIGIIWQSYDRRRPPKEKKEKKKAVSFKPWEISWLKGAKAEA